LATNRLDSRIDSSSIERLAAQIREAVEGTLCVLLRAGEGEVVWTSDRSEHKSWTSRLPPRAGAEARRAALGGGRHFYEFPMQADNHSNLTLSLLVVRLEPPSTGAVFRLIQPLLECVERQLMVDATLSKSVHIPAEVAANLALISTVNELVPADTLERSLAALAELCRGSLKCESVAIMAPHAKLQIFAPSSAEKSRTLVALLGRIFAESKANRRILLARHALSADRDVRTAVLSCPIADPTGQIVGLFAAIGDTLAKDHARVARAVSSKVDLLIQQFTFGRPKFLSRDEFIELVDQSLQRLPSTNHSVLYFDADKTHLINDSFGYEAGDEAIKTMASIIKENAGHNQAVAHLMGDRFALLLRDVDSPAAFARGEHILQLLERESLERGGKKLDLSASVGIATAPSVARDGAELLTIAEVASRGAKERGGRQCAVFQSVDASMIQRRSDADQVGYLQMALIDDRFVPYGQEIRSLNESGAKKLEVLIRLRSDDGTLVPPDKFLPAAERYQMMSAIDRWVIRSTLGELAKGTNSFDISLATYCINVSPQSLREPTFVEYIENAITESGVAPDTLCFELTETAMVRNFEQAQRFINRLQKRGCRVALDDFGMGYSSFAYLKHLPVQYIKVDGAFVRDVLESPLSEAIIASVVRIADVMSAATVAEHIENELVMQKLRTLGVNFGQGYHIHRPEPLGDLLAKLDKPGLEPAELCAEAAEPR
jgi:diguanylate cyclase (GGDEF)-like protein